MKKRAMNLIHSARASAPASAEASKTMSLSVPVAPYQLYVMPYESVNTASMEGMVAMAAAHSLSPP